MISILSSTESKTNECKGAQEINRNERQEYFQDKEEPITYMDRDEVTETGSPNGPGICLERT